jgi:prevent-host-death family protein
MSKTTLSCREFNQQVSRAKKAAEEGPVFITDRGEPAHVLITYEEYQRLCGSQRKIADLLALPGMEKEELDLQDLRDLPQPADIS